MTEFVSGNIFVRPMHFVQAGYKIQLHDHPFDHTTIVFRGKVRIYAIYGDGHWAQKDIDAPAHCLISKDVRHELTALEDDTVVWCVYSHRNAAGEVVQTAEEAVPESYNSGMPDHMHFSGRPPTMPWPPERRDDRLVIHRHG